jgi:hypothetical protein
MSNRGNGLCVWSGVPSSVPQRLMRWMVRAEQSRRTMI